MTAKERVNRIIKSSFKAWRSFCSNQEVKELREEICQSAINCKDTHTKRKKQTLEVLESCRMSKECEEEYYEFYNSAIEACIYELKRKGLA